jgi:Ca2+/Na+ antiporter
MSFDMAYLIVVALSALVAAILCLISAIKYREEAAFMYILPMTLAAVFYILFFFVIKDQIARAYIGRGIFMSTILTISLMRYNRIRRGKNDRS